MRQYLALAAAFSLAAGAAQAQLKPMPSMQPIPPFGAPVNIPGMIKPYRPPEPPKTVNVYDDGPFSPAAEERRARKANAAPAGGMFSPEAEAKRERERAKTFHPF